MTKAVWVTLALVVVPGGCLLGAALWLRQQWIARAAAQAEALIHPPVVKFPTADERVRFRTTERRKAADTIRKRAAKVETGAPVSDVLRAVK